MNQCELYQEIISRLVDGELSRNEYAALDAHMENCAECSAMYAVFASLSDIIGSEDEPLPEDLHENIMAGVRRSAMINRNRNKRKLTKPMRNAIAAAACAALVIFAAKGFDPAEKAQSNMVSKSEAVVMDTAAQQRHEEIVVESVTEAAPVEAPTAAAPAAVPSPAPTAAPAAAPAPTRDIYLDPVPTAAPGSTPAVQTSSPAPIVVQTPVFVSTPQPAATQAPVQAEQAAPAPAAAYEPAPESYEPEIEQAAPAAEAPAEEAAPAAVNEAEGVAVDESPVMAAAPEAPAEPEETPSAQSRLFGFFGMARNAEPESEEETPAEAGPVATESPAEETAPAENGVIEEVAESPEPEEKKKPLPVVRIKKIEKLSELEDMIDGREEEALPDKKADKAYCFCLAEPGEMFKDYKLEVYIIEGKIWYKQIFAKDDFVICSSECKLEDFEKFMDSLSDEEKAELIQPSPSPSPEIAPTESPVPEEGKINS